MLLIGPVPPPAGGVATSTVALGRALERRGLPVALIDPARGRLGLVAALVRALPRRKLVHVHVCGHNAGSYLLLALVRAAAPWSPTVVTLHSGILPDYLLRLAPTAQRAVVGLLDAVDSIICVNQPNADAVISLGLSPTRVTVAPAFIAESVHRDLTTRPRSPAMGPQLAAMVAPEALYGADVLVEGFSRIAAHHPTARLRIFGTGGADRAVAAALADRGYGARVAALGELQHDAVLGLLRDSDVLVRPTRADGDSICVREALALGTRVVASDVVARPRGTFLFRSDDAAALAARVLGALEVPPPPPPTDGLDAVLAVYRRLGLPITSAP